jgi:dethiobiotin synthetase
MPRAIFVTGTDTGVGKTVAATAILRGLAAAGVRAVGMKPVSAGVDAATGRNEDVDALAAVSGVDAPLADRNPFAFAAPVAPHLAAQREGREIDVAMIRDAFLRLASSAEAVVIEGAGGALVPIDDRLDMLDIAHSLRVPVVLVVGVRLGCLHHARTTLLAIRARGVPLAGWIASRIDPRMALAGENVAWLTREFGAPPAADIANGGPAALSGAALRALGLL